MITAGVKTAVAVGVVDQRVKLFAGADDRAVPLSGGDAERREADGAVFGAQHVRQESGG